MKCNDNCSV